MANVNIKFNGKNFLLSCDDGQEEHLEELLIQINQKFSDLKNEIKAINKGKALEKILPDAWISKDIKDAKAFITWVKSSIFYDLTYNDNDEAIKMINEIL